MPSNLYSRTLANYTFNITATDEIQPTISGSMMMIDFPTNYDLITNTYTCLNKTANLGTSMNCSQNQLLLKVSGQTDQVIGNIVFLVEGIKNPQDQVVTDTFFVRTYDGTSQQIMERSFQNLDPFDFNFTFPGPLIVVNNDQAIYCEIGTQTVDLYITVSEICALNLTLIPVTPGFSFVPNQIKVNIGQVQIVFRVSIPIGFTQGTYYVTWQTLGDLTPPLYTPIKKSTVVITGKGSRN